MFFCKQNQNQCILNSILIAFSNKTIVKSNQISNKQNGFWEFVVCLLIPWKLHHSSTSRILLVSEQVTLYLHVTKILSLASSEFPNLFFRKKSVFATQCSPKRSTWDPFLTTESIIKCYKKRQIFTFVHNKHQKC